MGVERFQTQVKLKCILTNYPLYYLDQCREKDAGYLCYSQIVLNYRTVCISQHEA